MLAKVLVANRGEIACRVIRTCRRLGIATVAVFSDADEHALHRSLADESMRLGPPPARESYLDIERIMAAARESGAAAIHPGYGFLSENPDFAEACTSAGLVFIGPPPTAMRAMADKAAAKRIAAAAGIPVLPGSFPGDQSDAALLAAAEEIGWPVLIKAVAGGGGRGMRRVDGPADWAKSLAGARREAAASFGDDGMMVERCVARPRHVEVQIFADAQGNVVHLFERDCSLQRRHQKVLEEAPAPGLPGDMRARMTEAAVRLAQAIGYQGAGTVEFIADIANGPVANGPVANGPGADGFWFLEMNTRLQVEHPVTEAITGLDLVEWQIRVADGESLPLPQERIARNGHAVEARICAEDPARRDLPSPGTLRRLDLPGSAEGVRLDTGFRTGDVVSPHYDSLLAKLIVHAPTREAALRRLAAALGQGRIDGVASNLRFLQAVASHAAFGAGEIDTGFLDRFRAELLAAAAPDSAVA